MYKDPPYVLKESGYASFNLPIEIYLKAGPRDEPKKYSLTYDLDIAKTTVQKYPLLVANPSSDFRHKLLDGGGIMINHDGKILNANKSARSHSNKIIHSIVLFRPFK